jgi:hypothetical protein
MLVENDLEDSTLATEVARDANMTNRKSQLRYTTLNQCIEREDIGLIYSRKGNVCNNTRIDEVCRYQSIRCFSDDVPEYSHDANHNWH